MSVAFVRTHVAHTHTQSAGSRLLCKSGRKHSQSGTQLMPAFFRLQMSMCAQGFWGVFTLHFFDVSVNVCFWRSTRNSHLSLLLTLLSFLRSSLTGLQVLSLNRRSSCQDLKILKATMRLTSLFRVGFFADCRAMSWSAFKACSSQAHTDTSHLRHFATRAFVCKERGPELTTAITAYNCHNCLDLQVLGFGSVCESCSRFSWWMLNDSWCFKHLTNIYKCLGFVSLPCSYLYSQGFKVRRVHHFKIHVQWSFVRIAFNLSRDHVCKDALRGQVTYEPSWPQNGRQTTIPWFHGLSVNLILNSSLSTTLQDCYVDPSDSKRIHPDLIK